MTSDFTYKKIITVHGDATIDITNIGLDLEIGLSTATATPAYDLAPVLKILKDDVVINSSDVSIKLSGSVVAKIASLIIPLIKSSMIPQIVDQVKTAIEDAVNTKVDPELLITQQMIPYLAGVSIDYGQLDGGPTITTDNVFELALNGTFFVADKPLDPITPVVFPLRNPTGKTLQGYLTDYVINTFLNVGFETGSVTDITELLAKLNVTLLTDDFANIIPELLTKYGPGLPVTIAMGMVGSSAPTAAFTPSTNTFTGNFAITLGVGTETAIQAEFDLLSFAAIFTTSTTSPGEVFGMIQKNSLGTISNYQSTLPLTSAQLLSELQTNINTQIATLNTKLAAGIVIPSYEGIDFSDVELNNNAGFIEAGISVTPAFFLTARDIYNSFSQEAAKINAGVYKV